MKTRRWPLYSLLAFGYAFLNIDLNDLTGQIFMSNNIGNGCTNVACSNYCNLVHIWALK